MNPLVIEAATGTNLAESRHLMIDFIPVVSILF